MSGLRTGEKMAKLDKELKEWWTKTLLGEQHAAHPLFSNGVKVDVDGGVVTLTGTVSSVDEAMQLEREAHSLDTVQTVVNRLRVSDGHPPYHMQTVVALFPDSDTARLACQALDDAKFHDAGPPTLIDSRRTAREILSRRAQAAHISRDAIKAHVAAVKGGKVLLVDRVPEDDALRVISQLEGSQAESIKTLPPEPDVTEE